MYDNSELRKGDVFYIVDKGMGVRKCKVLKRTVKPAFDFQEELMVVKWKHAGDKGNGYENADLVEKGNCKYYFKKEKKAIEYFNKGIKKLNCKLEDIGFLMDQLFQKAFQDNETMECFQYRVAIEKYIGSLKENADEGKGRFETLKSITKREVGNILKHPEKKENLMDLKSVIITMHDTYGIITQKQAEELLNPIEKAGDKFYREYVEEAGKNRDAE